MQQDGLIGDPERTSDVVRDDDPGDAARAAQMQDEFVDRLGADRIESGRGFVVEHERGIQRDGARECGALALSARQVGGHSITRVGESDQVEQVVRPRPPCGAVHPRMFAERELHVLADRHRIEECAALEQEADPPADRAQGAARQPMHRGAVHEDLAGVGADQAHDVPEHHALATAARSEDDQRLTPGYIQAESLEHAPRPEAPVYVDEPDDAVVRPGGEFDGIGNHAWLSSRPCDRPSNPMPGMAGREAPTAWGGAIGVSAAGRARAVHDRTPDPEPGARGTRRSDARRDAATARGHGDAGGRWIPVRPVAENPLSWSFPLGTCAGAGLRVHAALPLFLLIEIARAIPAPDPSVVDPIDVRLVGLSLACLLVSLAIHEAGHLSACRRLGGRVGEIILWPLGGLGGYLLPRDWRSRFIVAAAGPLANFALFLVIAPVLYLLTGVVETVALPSPLSRPEFGVLALRGEHGGQPWWLLLLATFHRVNFTVMLLTLLPMEPLDGARLLRAVAGSRGDVDGAARRVGQVGVVFGPMVALAGIVLSVWTLTALGAIGAALGWQRLRHQAWMEGRLDGMGRPLAPSTGGRAGVAEDARHADAGAVTGRRGDPGRRAPQAPEPDEGPGPPDARPVGRADTADDDALLDHLLARISTVGLAGLTEAERGLLARETERKRRRDDAARSGPTGKSPRRDDSAEG